MWRSHFKALRSIYFIGIEESMCGIFGVVSNQNIIQKMLAALKHLEYRGYDSAGIAFLDDNRNIVVEKVVGKVQALIEKTNSYNPSSTVAIGHTRWATHGEPSVKNAHPIYNDTVKIVHNGIIENHAQIKEKLISAGHQFTSDTDTEVMCHLIADYVQQGLSNLDAMKAAYNECEGAYSILALFDSNPNELLCCRKGIAQLLIGLGQGEMYIGSDAVVLSTMTNKVFYLEDGDITVVNKDMYKVFENATSKEVQRKIKTISSAVAADKGDYKHYMLKEIYEQPYYISKNLSELYDKFSKKLKFPTNIDIDWEKVSRIKLIACGTSYYAACVAKYWFERYTGLIADVECASEFRYRNPVLGKNDVYIFLSQSGETLDTLAALQYVKEAKHQGKLISIVNVPTSPIGNGADILLPINVGLEIGVASTKAFTGQLLILALLTFQISQALNMEDFWTEELNALHDITAKMESVLGNSDEILEIAKTLASARNVLYTGRDISYPISLEGALKMKELSYIPTQGFSGGELKHGPIALVDENTFIIVSAPYDEIFPKIASNVQEIYARKGKVILISTEAGCAALKHQSFRQIILPETTNFTHPFLTVLPMQLLAYHVASVMGHDVDQPRNLAKSVTVE